MLGKKPKCNLLRNQRGFTFVELLMVMGIMGMLAAIAVQQIKFNRENAYDRQAQTVIRTLLTYAAVEEPNPPVGEENQSGIGGNLTIYGYSGAQIPDRVSWQVINDGSDRWQFFFAHPGGVTGFYFWIPGDSYAGDLDDDGSGNRSDKLFSDISYRDDAGII